MPKKYIPQREELNFVFPNSVNTQYDDEIIHDINNESVSGTITNISITSASSAGFTLNFDWTWNKNGAEPFISNGGNINLISVHMIAPPDSYFNAWRTIGLISNATTTNSTYSGSFSQVITPAQYSSGTPYFTNGIYNFEFRLLGKRAVNIICAIYDLETIPVSPTPTPTKSPLPPTPTPTPSATPTYSQYHSGVTINVTDVGYIKYQTISGTTYYNCTTLGNTVLPDCLICSTIQPGFPLADLATWTLVNCGASCSGVVPPSVSPTPTPSTAPTTFGYYRMFNCQDYQTYYSTYKAAGLFNSGDRVQGSYGYFYVITGFQTFDPGVGLYDVTGTGFSGCP